MITTTIKPDFNTAGVLTTGGPSNNRISKLQYRCKVKLIHIKIWTYTDFVRLWRDKGIINLLN